VTWDPAGRRLASAGYDGTVRIWNVDPKHLISMACRRTGRNMTWDEHERYLEANMPLRTCSQWPVHPSVIAEAERLARRGLMDDAVILLKRVKEEQPELDLDPQTHARQAAELAQAERGEAQVARMGSDRRRSRRRAAPTEVAWMEWGEIPRTRRRAPWIPPALVRLR
jgi:hypothetical protein